MMPGSNKCHKVKPSRVRGVEFVCGGGDAISDGEVREGFFERATFQQVQSILFPTHSRLEAVH
jgi:hypothetical protein